MMTRSAVRHRLTPALLACAAVAGLMASPTLAQDVGGATVDPRLLVEQLVAEGVITRDQADRMIRNATVPAPARQTAALPPVPAGGVSADGVVTVPYIPNVVRDQRKQELRAELGQQAQVEGWAQPGQTPEWTRRLTLTGDIRVRGDGLFLDEANFPDFLDWNAINQGPGFQANDAAPGYVNPPYLNATEDRNRARVRARLGLTARIDDWIMGEIRLATGNDRSPVSTNQTLGEGDSGKYAIWLDRANIRLQPTETTEVVFGRFANPFWTSELLFDEDLNFDGVAASARAALGETVSVSGTAGVFPIFSTALNFSSRDAGAFESKDRYLYGAQLGVDFRPTEKITGRLSGGYFLFDGAQGEFSSPCSFIQDVCDTDATRPLFQQFGNTMFALRNITPNPDPSVPPGASPEVQYFGLASEYEVLNIHGQLDFTGFAPIGVRLEGDFIQNLGFDRDDVAGVALNNFAPQIGTQGGEYDGGDLGWQTRLIVGHPDLDVPGQWNFHAGYRYIESDATVDAFADSDFGLGGTNAKGWFVGGAYVFGRMTSLGGRWISTDEVAGPPLSVNRLYVDLATRF